MPAWNSFGGRATMKPLALCLMLAMMAGPAPAATVADPARDARPLTDAVYIRPLYGAYRHCGGACLKSGALSWFCFANRTCALNCATAPPLMKCAAP